MGMYDYLKINVDLLPISTEEKNRLRDRCEWQTKDLDCTLTEVVVTDDEHLTISRWEYEEVPLEERPYPNDTGFLSLAGSLRRVNKRMESVNHHLFVNFYTDVDDIWYEFKAEFNHGKLIKIEIVNI